MTAKIILDSISPVGVRLTTMTVRMHRFVLPEFNTHRVFSRSSASSRAIPVDKMFQRFCIGAKFPVEWPSEQPGMQGGEELEGRDLEDAFGLFDHIHHEIQAAIDDYLTRHPDKSTRLHKSVLNRLMEPFLEHEVIVTSTEWENFFKQRCSPLAQPEIRVAAEAMRDALEASTPVEVPWGEWHTPYITEDERANWSQAKQLRVSVARCARVSYLNHEGQYDPAADERLFRRLVTADPPHWAPLEMVAAPQFNPPSSIDQGNFYRWKQLRHSDWEVDGLMIDQENTNACEDENAAVV